MHRTIQTHPPPTRKYARKVPITSDTGREDSKTSTIERSENIGGLPHYLRTWNRVSICCKKILFLFQAIPHSKTREPVDKQEIRSWNKILKYSGWDILAWWRILEQIIRKYSPPSIIDIEKKLSIINLDLE